MPEYCDILGILNILSLYYATSLCQTATIGNFSVIILINILRYLFSKKDGIDMIKIYDIMRYDII